MQGQYNIMVTPGTKPAYVVKEIDSHDLKDVHSPMSTAELDKMTAATRKEYNEELKDLTEKMKLAKGKKKLDEVAVHKISIRNLKGTKRRALRMYEVTFRRKHSNILDEVAMSEQRLFKVAPLFHEESNEMLPDSVPEGYIGLAKDEFVISYTDTPEFK